MALCICQELCHHCCCRTTTTSATPSASTAASSAGSASSSASTAATSSTGARSSSSQSVKVTRGISVDQRVIEVSCRLQAGSNVAAAVGLEGIALRVSLLGTDFTVQSLEGSNASRRGDRGCDGVFDWPEVGIIDLNMRGDLPGRCDSIETVSKSRGCFGEDLKRPAACGISKGHVLSDIGRASLWRLGRTLCSVLHVGSEVAVDGFGL